jgi:hypothetical protein
MWADNTATTTDLYNIALFEVTGSTPALTGRKECSYPYIQVFLATRGNIGVKNMAVSIVPVTGH